MADAIRKIDRPFTYNDYLAWPEDDRWELIDGVAYKMSAAPSRRHQEIAYEIVRQLAPQLEGHPCKAYFAPFDVRLPENREQDDADIITVVQPDIVLVCDDSKLDEAGMRGAPDFVIEILSPYTLPKDLRRKSELYARHGVKEYWVIHPSDEVLYVFLPELRITGEPVVYGDPAIYEPTGFIELSAIPNLRIDMKRLFARA